jgi:hypothetical protein
MTWSLSSMPTRERPSTAGPALNPTNDTDSRPESSSGPPGSTSNNSDHYNGRSQGSTTLGPPHHASSISNMSEE